MPKHEFSELQGRLSAFVGTRLPADPVSHSLVLSWLREPRWSTRLGAIRVLAQWPGGPPPDTVQRMLASLDDRRGLESYPARLEAASFLINHDPYSQEAIALCLEALTYGTRAYDFLPQSDEVRKEAVLILSKLKPLYYDDEVYERLRHVMTLDEGAEVRDAAYEALVRMARLRELRAEQVGA